MTRRKILTAVDNHKYYKLLKMDYQSELYLNPLFNYLEYYKSGKFTDCELIFEDSSQPPIRAHAAILANSSTFFKNALTGNMAEAKSGKLPLFANPMNLLPKVIEFMYCGKIEYTEDQVMSLLHIANTYIIPSLQERMVSYLRDTVNHDNIYLFANQCYQYELERELSHPTDGLVPLFIKLFDKLPIKNLTKNLDVVTFTKILDGLSPADYDVEAKIRYLDEFVGDWKCDDVDKEACVKLFDIGNSRTRNLLTAAKHTWLPPL